MAIPDGIDLVRIPLSIAIWDVDFAMKVAQVHKAKEILEKKNEGDHEVVINPGAKHEFAVRRSL